MAGTYWLTILPDTSKLKPAIEAAMRGQKIEADFGVDEAKARKAGKEAAAAAEQEANKAKPKVRPEADKSASKKAGDDAAEEARKPVEQKRPKVRPAPDVPGSRKAGEEAGDSAAAGMLGSLKKLGPIMAGLGLAGGLKSSIAEGMNFTESLNVMRGVLNESAATMSVVSERAKQLGADATLPGVSATTAATAMTELAKGGFSASEAMEAVRGTLALAGAAGIDAAEAATIQSDAMNTFQLQSTEAGRVADLLTNAANASTVEVPQMAQALAQAGSAAGGFGISIEDTLTSLAMFANFGIKGSDAGTLMKTSLLAITDGGKPATEAMNALGLELYKAGEFVGYPEMLRQVADASKRMSEEQFQGATAVLFGSDAMRGAMIAANGGAEAFNETAQQVVNGAGAAAMAEARMRGLPGAWANFQNTLDGVKMSIYDMVKGPLESLLNTLSGIPEFITRNADAFKIAAGVITTLLVPALTAWTIAQAKAIGTSIAGAVSALIGSWTAMAGAIMNAAAAAGTYAIAIARGVATSIVAGISSMVAAFRNLAIGTRIAAAAQAAFNLVMMANPIVLIVAAIAALVAGLVYFFTQTELGQKIWAKFTEYLKVAWDGIKNAFAAAWDFIGNIWDSMVTKAGEVWQGIKDKFTMVVDFVKGLPGRIGDAAKGMWDGISNAFKSMVDKLKGWWNGFASKLSFTSPEWLPGDPVTFSLPTFASGGRVKGPGSGTSDSILGAPAMVRVSNGEYIVNAAATAKHLPLLEAINSGKLPGFAAGGLTPHATEMKSLISRMFGVTNIGGYREPDGYNEHSTGNALDVMIPNSGTDSGKALGDSITAWALKNAKAIGLTGAIWRQTSYGYGGGFSGSGKAMPDRGSPTANHFDHVHLFMNDAPDKTLSLSGAPSMGSGSLVGASTSAGGSGSYRAATQSELSGASGKVDTANKAVTQAQQRVDDRTFTRDRAQQRLDQARAAGKDTVDEEQSLLRANRELQDATDNLAEKRQKAADAEQALTDLQTNGKYVESASGSADSVASTATGKSGPNTGDLGSMFVGGVLESIGLDGSLFSNPLEWPSVKSLMAGINYAGGLLSIVGAKPEDQGGATTVGSSGGFAAGAAEAVGLGGLTSAIPSITENLLPSGMSGSPALAPGEFNPAVAGGTAMTAAPGMSAFAPHQGGGQKPGPAVDNSININGNVGMSPDALQTKLRNENNARTRTTVVK